MMAKYFGGLLQKGSGSFGADNKHSGVLVNMSAKVGSITDNGRSLLEDIHTRLLYNLKIEDFSLVNTVHF